MQQKVLKYAQEHESKTLAAALKSTIVTFSSPTYPKTSISREPQHHSGEPATDSWAQHNKDSWDFHVGPGEFTHNKSYALASM